MSRAWMPLYVADYLADTGHLSALEHGAYMLLIMHYWQKGGLPDDDRRLAQICRMSAEEFDAHREVLADFFADGWTHPRIEEELEAANEIAAKARAKANKRWGRKPQQSYSNAAAQPAQCQSQSPSSVANATDGAGPVLAGRTDDFEADVQAVVAREMPSASPAPPIDPVTEPFVYDRTIAERELFERGVAVLGARERSTIGRLLKAKGRNVALARAAVEEASQRHDPKSYLYGIIKTAEREGSNAPEAKPGSVRAAAETLERRIAEMLTEGGGGADPVPLRLLSQGTG